MVTITRPNVFLIPMPTHDLLVNLLSISRAALFPRAPPLGNGAQEEFLPVSSPRSSTSARCDVLTN